MILSSCNKIIPKNAAQTTLKRTSYYFSNQGNDTDDGSIKHPFKTLAHIKTIHFNAGDSILLKGNEVFNDSIILKTNGTSGKPVLLASYGNGNAIINADNRTAVSIYQSSFINLKNIICIGSGRKNGNTKPGVNITDCGNINLDDIDVSGFQKSGLQLYNCRSTTLKNVNAHDNGAAGIGVEGDFSNKLGSNNIRITNCSAVNNPGDPSNLTNHSGNGIVVGHCTNVLIDHCIATNNGWDMPRIGNGPVGIWAYEADSVIIQHCLSYKNKTSAGAADGGGFDFDGGVTNSILQYCLSYQNQGSGYCIFQYWDASPWYNNVVRFNISIDDGLVSDSRAGIYVWNSS
ncbi:MAG: right-handed parallel beta-helix repeat-containing protein, partial [Parafilimonas sp.]